MNTSKEPVVIITGAFQSAGGRTVLVDRSKDRLESTYPDLAGSKNHFLAGEIDLVDPAALSRLIMDTVARFSRVDVLVNTVGGYRGGKPVHEDDLANWDFLFNINVRTTLLACRAVIPEMLRQGRGKIVNVASRTGLMGSAGYSAYSASKSAVLRLTESLAQELKDSNINVNCVMPATIDTPQNRQASPGADFSKWVEPAAIADVILFLASDAARAITGAALPVFGRG